MFHVLVVSCLLLKMYSLMDSFDSFFSFFVCFVCLTQSLYPIILHVDQAGLELGDLPASASQNARIVCTTPFFVFIFVF